MIKVVFFGGRFFPSYSLVDCVVNIWLKLKFVVYELNFAGP